MITVVCPGWGATSHGLVVLQPGDPNNVSHGMCAACLEIVNLELRRHEEYREYLESIFDPRD